MRDIAITAGVNITVPVIAQAGAAVVREGELPSGSQSVQALRATRALRPPQETVSLGGTRNWFRVVACNCTLRANAPRSPSQVESALVTALGFGQIREWAAEWSSRSECGLGGWPRPHFYLL